MKQLREFLASKPSTTFAVAVLLGILLSYLHEITQSALIPVGEWARITFISTASNEFLAENLVNFFFQLVTFSFAYASALALMAVLISIKTMFYPLVAFITYLVLALWWIPVNFIFDLQPDLKAALPFLPTVIFAAVVVFLILTSFAIRKRAENKA